MERETSGVTWVVPTILNRGASEGSSRLLLGQWCLPKLHKSSSSASSARVLSYHWDDRRQLKRDVTYLFDLYERLLPQIRDHLNYLHGTDHSVRYWRILIGHWLLLALQVVFDRWTIVEALQDFDEPLACKGLVAREVMQVHQNFSEFSSAVETDAWNEQFFVMLMSMQGVVEMRGENRPSNAGSETSGQDRAEVSNVTKGVRNTIGKSWVVRCFSNLRSYSLHETCLGLLNSVRLQLLLGSVPHLTSRLAPSKESPADAMREWRLSPEPGNPFETAVSSLVPMLMPICYLESYHASRAQALNHFGNKPPILLFTCASFNSDDSWKFFAAEMIEAGSKLVLGQHGGGYGLHDFSMMEKEEIQISDAYLTWGWNDESHSHVKASVASRLIGLRHGANRRPEHLLQVLAEVPQYSSWLYSFPMGPQFETYVQDQFTFARGLSGEAKRNLLVRLHKTDYGWQLRERWCHESPASRIQPRGVSMEKSLKRARIVIATYNSTVPLESMFLNIPTVMFWRPDLCELRSSAQEIFCEMEELCMFFPDPEGCATFVSECWEEIESWWFSSDVQDVRHRFCRDYAHVGDFPLRQLRGDLKHVANCVPTRNRV